MYTLKLRGREVGFMLSEIGQDRQALLAINLGGVGASIHKGQSCEEGLALLLALEGQLWHNVGDGKHRAETEGDKKRHWWMRKGSRWKRHA